MTVLHAHLCADHINLGNRSKSGRIWVWVARLGLVIGLGLVLGCRSGQPGFRPWFGQNLGRGSRVLFKLFTIFDVLAMEMKLRIRKRGLYEFGDMSWPELVRKQPASLEFSCENWESLPEVTYVSPHHHINHSWHKYDRTQRKAEKRKCPEAYLVDDDESLLEFVREGNEQ